MKQLGKKQKFTLLAGVLAVVAFFCAFIAPLKATLGTLSENASFGDAFFGDGVSYNGALLSFVGFVLILAAGVYLVVSAVKGKSGKLNVAAIGALVVGAILVFLTETFYVGSMIIPEGTPEAYVTLAKETAAEMLSLGFGTLVGGILAVASAACAAVAKFVIKED